MGRIMPFICVSLAIVAMAAYQARYEGQTASAPLAAPVQVISSDLGQP